MSRDSRILSGSIMESQAEPQSAASPVLREGCCCGYRLRRVRSKAAVLVLVWSILVYTAYLSSVTTVNALLRELLEPVSNTVEAVGQIIVYLLAVWLADVYFGRYKVIRTSLWLMLISSVLGVIALIIRYQVSESDTALRYSALLLVYIFNNVGFASFLANAVAFGTDQLVESPGEDISAFVDWFVWAWYPAECLAVYLVGRVIPICANLDPESNATALVQSLVPVTALSLALCFDYLFRDCLSIEDERQNPLRTVFGVLKYAVTHKYPPMRSAFANWEENAPSRIDMCKPEYGGSFVVEKVEDVKSFLRIAVIIVCSSVFLIPQTYDFIDDHFYHPSQPYCSEAIIDASHSDALMITALIPLYEILLHPFVRNWIPSTLKRIAVSAFIAIFVYLLLLIADTVGHAYSSEAVPCIFLESNDSTAQLPIHYLGVAIPQNLLLALVRIIYMVAVLEFIISQTPYSMKGALIGVWYVLQNCSYILENVLTIAWHYGWQYSPVSNGAPSCGTWYYATRTAVAIIGLILFSMVARSYKQREREETPVTRDHAFAVDYDPRTIDTGV